MGLRDNTAVSYGSIVWGQFRKNRLAYAGLWMVVVLVLLAVYAPLICLDVPFWITATIDGQRVTEYPWLVTLFDRNVFENTVDVFFNLLLVLSPLIGGTAVAARLWERARPGARVLVRTLGAWAAIVAVIMIGLASTPTSRPLRDYVALYNAQTVGVDAELERLALESPDGQVDPKRVAALEASRAEAGFPPVPRSFTRPELDAVMSPIGRSHLMGTDSSGRDVFARMLYGTRISLTIGVLAVSLYITIGVMIGALAGYFRGWVDTIVLRMVEVMLCFPSFILILTLAAFVEQPSIFYVMLIIGLTRWTGPARLTRGEFLRLGHQDFVMAAIASGIPQWRVIVRHVLPNALGPVLVNATFGIASAILVEASLAFLGLSDPSAPSWGEMLNIGRNTQSTSLILIAGTALFVTLSTFNLVGEGVRDALDPKLRK